MQLSQEQFEQINKDAGRPSTIEAWIQTSDEQTALGNSPPDAGEWTDSNGKSYGTYVQKTSKPRIRERFRNNCVWREVTLPDGSTGVYALPHGSALHRF
jgi:hypothetical protein